MNLILRRYLIAIAKKIKLDTIILDKPAQKLRKKIKNLSQQSISQQDPSGWFEPLYAQAQGNSQGVPWAKNQAHPYLQDWLNTYPPSPEGKSALVIGCGLGDDAELLANCGYRVTAFDISPTAIAWCKTRFPQSSVNYVVGDLFALDPAWQEQFDFVFECRNIQALPLNVRSQIISAIAPLVASNGILLVVTHYRKNNTVPDGPPWALSDAELSLFTELGLTEIRRDRSLKGSSSIIEQHRIEYHR